MTEPTAVDRRTGRAAVAAGVLLSASVAAELVWTVQRPDGAVTNLAGFALYLTAWTAGAVALVVALLGLGGTRSAAGPLPRIGRIGRGIAARPAPACWSPSARSAWSPPWSAEPPPSGRSCSSRWGCC